MAPVDRETICAWALAGSRGGAWPHVVSLSDEVEPLLGRPHFTERALGVRN